jgi:nucleotide-binding universal stress UspA family protein
MFVLDGPILWVVHLADCSADHIEHVVSLFGNLPLKTGTKIKPVIVRPYKQMRAADLERAKSVFRAIKMDHLETPEIVQGLGDSSDDEMGDEMGDEIDAIDKFARDTNASLIIVGNTEHSILKRLLIGSFSERLILRSTAPVLVFGSRSRIESSIRKIFVPTDFDLHAHNLFLKALEFARSVHASIDLYHCLPDELNSGLDFSGPLNSEFVVNGKLVDFFAYREAYINKKKEQAQDWLREAESLAIDARFKIEIAGDSNADILDHELKGFDPDLIIMETHSSPFKAVLLGSVSRHLARKASCPVLVYSPKFFENEMGMLGRWPDLGRDLGI